MDGWIYDQIQGETIAADRTPSTTPKPAEPSSSDTPAAISESRQNLNTEFQETIRAFSNSPWGAKLGGLWGNVRKQGENYYEGARKEVTEASGEALKGFTDLKESLVSRTRGLSVGDNDKPSEGATDSEAAKLQGDEDRKTEDLISRFKSEAAKRIKEIEKAEDAADEALLRFGTNIRNFLRDAVSVTAPSDDKQAGGVMFESKDASGKRVIHTTRFDAQLHVIHSSLDSFMRDPVSGEWSKFKEAFKIDGKTEDISKDLEKYPELRKAMEQLVPEKVEYSDFWCRYYFLRLVIETEEQKRKELLKGMWPIGLSPIHAYIYQGASAGADEEVGWDEDSEDETPRTPQAPAVNGSSETLQTPKPEGRKSDDQHSRPDSDTSYDLVSGPPSRAPGSPKEDLSKTKKEEESDEEDWE